VTEFAVMANKGGYNGLIRFPLLGRFNVENCLAAMMVAHFEGIDFSYVTKALEKFFVCGREEKICLENGAVVLIDYAHNAASIESILRDVSLYHFKRIISLFGCGGNRSSGRRESMGEVSGRYADLSIITEDNSRFEDTDNIIEDIVKGVLKSSGKYVIIKDRRKAIEYSLEISRKGDIILLLGKGHERYQEKNGVREPFSEREIVENYRMEK